jgi:hypothetical protein
VENLTVSKWKELSVRLSSLAMFVMTISVIVACKSKPNDKPIGLKLYVSPLGNDNWTGRISDPDKTKSDGPFATIEGARNTIRRLKETNKLPIGSVLVEVREGAYEQLRPFELNELDSGNDSLSAIIYSGQKGKDIRLTGGRYITGWQPVTDNKVLAGFSREVRSKIVRADLKALGIDDFGSPAGGGSELFFNDLPMQISRYPNEGYIKITGLLNEDPVDIRGTKGDKSGKFKYSDRRVSQWKHESDGWVHGYWFWDWSEERHKIEGIDTVNKILKVMPPYHTYGYRIGQWFYGFNLLSEIDEPGEYYIDRPNGFIYFYPPSDIEKGKAYISVNKNIISMDRVSFVSIEGMIIEGCRETAIKIHDSKGTMVGACTVRNTGDGAVIINGGVQNGVSGCDIYNTGGFGIMIEAGDRKTLSPGKCFADNNYIHHIARLKRVYNPGITINGAGNRISHNLIAHVPHMAIGFMGNDHLIEYNEIDSACYESNDAGAIYTGRNWTMRGNIIRYNYLHDISGFEGKGCVGIYLDDAFSSADITGNIFRNVTRAMMIGGGRDNHVLNNIFINCLPAIHVDARGLGWMRNEHIPGWIKEAEDSGTILGIAYNKPPYSIRYPKLSDILNDEPRAPKGNVISNNICSGGVWDKASGFWHMSIEDKARPYLTMELNIISPETQVEDSLSKSFIVTDPGFVDKEDPERGQFMLRSDSPALMHGFQQIPFGKIGPYQSENRASWPVNKN